MGGLLLKGLSFSGFAIPILTEIFIFIDSIIYLIADYALQAFFEIATISANVSQYSEKFNEILDRVMVLAGVFALFKLAFMLINYMVDPGKMKDVSKNGAGFVKGIILAFVLLVASPLIFSQLGRLQGLVIKQDVIPKLINGVTTKDGSETEEEWNGGNIKAQTKGFVNNVWLLFFTPKEDCSIKNDWYCQTYRALQTGDAGIITIAPAYNHFDYLPFISGIMGMVLIYYFALYAIELGTRIVKLVVLQILSPIPIIMSIDPNHSKKLPEFAKLYMSIYLQIFIRILTFYIAFEVCSLIVDSNFGTNIVSGGNIMLAQPGFVVKILLYIGIFQATKELPKLVDDALGLKVAESGKGFGKTLKTIITGTAVGTVGAVGGAVAGGISGGLTGGASSVLGSALAGGASGLFHGVMDGAKSKDVVAAVKAAGSGVKASFNTGANVARLGGLGQFMLGGVENKLGFAKKDKATLEQYDKDIENKNKSIEGVNKQIGAINKDIGTQNTRMNDLNRADQLKGIFENAYASKNGDFNSFLERNEQYTTARDLLANENSASIPENREYLQRQMDEAYKSATDTYNALRDKYYEDNFKALNDGNAVDPAFKQALEDYNGFVLSHGMEDRVIGSYKGDDGISSVEEKIMAEKDEIEKVIFEKQEEINNREEEIKRIEEERKAIEESKKQFKNSPEVARRDADKRKEGYKSKPRKTGNE